MAIEWETMAIMGINNALMGAAIATGFFIAMMIFIRMFRKELPGLIHQIQIEMIKANTMNRVDMIRNKYQ